MSQQLTTEHDSRLPMAPSRTLTAVRAWPDDAAQAWTLGVLEQAAANQAIVAIVATGSSVRDVEYSDDLDLILVYREGRPEMDRAPISIDLRCYEESEVLRKLAEGHDYLSWTVRYGQALFERGTWWTKRRADWDNRVRLPSEAEARARAQAAERLSNELREAGDEDAAHELELSVLTHLGRTELSRANVFPKSRPEITTQLRDIGKHELADRLADALDRRLEANSRITDPYDLELA